MPGARSAGLTCMEPPAELRPRNPRSDQPHVLEPASGASPAWYTTNFLDRGKKKLPGERPDRVSPVAQALTGNAWPGASESMMEKTGR